MTGVQTCALPIYANTTGTRELTRSSTGQPLFIDKLGSTAQVDITRERTAEPDPRSGQYSVLADQLVFKTGNSDDQVKVTQGENGQLRFDVNRSEAHTSELQSLIRISTADSCLKK